jgi:hypothetical protein
VNHVIQSIGGEYPRRLPVDVDGALTGIGSLRCLCRECASVAPAASATVTAPAPGVASSITVTTSSVPSGPAATAARVAAEHPEHAVNGGRLDGRFVVQHSGARPCGVVPSATFVRVPIRRDRNSEGRRCPAQPPPSLRAEEPHNNDGARYEGGEGDDVGHGCHSPSRSRPVANLPFPAGSEGSTRWGPLAPQSPGAAPSLSPRFCRLTAAHPPLDSANVDDAPSILTHAPVGCGRLRPMNRLFYGDNLTVLREAVASESVPRSPAHERDPQGCAYDEGGGDQPARFRPAILTR